MPFSSGTFTRLSAPASKPRGCPPLSSPVAPWADSPSFSPTSGEEAPDRGLSAVACGPPAEWNGSVEMEQCPPPPGDLRSG